MTAKTFINGHTVAWDEESQEWYNPHKTDLSKCSNCGKEQVMCLVNTPSECSHTGFSYWKRMPIDFCISGIVNALNGAGILTKSCCCGHDRYYGTIILQDGRTLIVCKTFNQAEKLIKTENYIKE